MSDPAPSPGEEINPFATRFVRPGALPFLCSKGDSLAAILARLKANHGWGQIIGPHGSGKSTLLAALLVELEQQNVPLIHITLHEGERFRQSAHRPATWNEKTQVVVDGYEQLSRFARWRLQRYCRRRGTGLLVTAHTNVGLPTLYHAHVETSIARQLVTQLMATAGHGLEEAAIAACLARHPQDLREAFFELYDSYESQGISQLKRPHTPT